MNILLTGSGGREHALAWKIAQSPLCTKLFIAPGNPGTARYGVNTVIPADDIAALVDFARQNRVDLTVVGPEAPLVAGITDEFAALGLKVFGPSGAAAMLEGSKAFTKKLCFEHHIPTAKGGIFTNGQEAKAFLQEFGAPVVVKADGLAAGKGVTVCSTLREALRAVDLLMEERVFGAAGDTLLIEECLTGEEVSVLAFCDGETVLPLEGVQDHKRVFDHDEGPNTGGMGAFSPTPLLTSELREKVVRRVLEPAVKAMAGRGIPFKGMLFAGIMVVESEPYLLEFNARFGDPETQPLMARLTSDLVEVMMACVEGTLKGRTLEWSPEVAVCVALTSAGYPGSFEKGKVISGLQEAEALSGVNVFQAGTTEKDGGLVTSGGRVLGVTARGPDIAGARTNAYEAAAKIQFEGKHFRRDIGAKALK